MQWKCLWCDSLFIHFCFDIRWYFTKRSWACIDFIDESWRKNVNELICKRLLFMAWNSIVVSHLYVILIVPKAKIELHKRHKHLDYIIFCVRKFYYFLYAIVFWVCKWYKNVNYYAFLCCCRCCCCCCIISLSG